MKIDNWEYLELKRSEIIGEAMSGNVYAITVKKWMRKYRKSQDDYTKLCLGNALEEYRDSREW